MAWYINEISLVGQHPTSQEFLAELRKLMELRASLPRLASQLFCSKSIGSRLVAPNHSFQRAVQSTEDRLLKSLVLNWLSKAGPFWEDEREIIADDYFECHQNDVTDLGLGEAARRKTLGIPAEAFSFSSGGFDYSPLSVTHGLPESPLAIIEMSNQWELEALRQAVESSTPPVVNWGQMLNEATRRFQNLNLMANCGNSLRPEPFSRCVAERVFELLQVLDEYASCMNEAGAPTHRNNELMTQYFTGKKSWFSDESSTNKREFKEKMTFKDPAQPNVQVFCSWHGKIKTPQFRIHFDWPPRPKTKIRVFYIGPKITKS